MMRVLAIGAAVLVAGCVADTMRGYVGQDIRSVMLAYGPPAAEIDLGGGARAFQWRRVSVDTTPISETTTKRRDKKGRTIEDTQVSGGNQTVSNCLYTFLTAWSPPQKGWVVTGFRQPSLDCSVGGLSS
jgi:hypothetical protein